MCNYIKLSGLLKEIYKSPYLFGIDFIDLFVDWRKVWLLIIIEINFEKILIRSDTVVMNFPWYGLNVLFQKQIMNFK